MRRNKLAEQGAAAVPLAHTGISSVRTVAMDMKQHRRAVFSLKVTQQHWRDSIALISGTNGPPI